MDTKGAVSRTNNGVTFTWNQDKTECTVVGTTTDKTATCKIYDSYTKLPYGIEPGKTYKLINYGDYVACGLTTYDSNRNPTNFPSVYVNYEIPIPVDAVGMYVRLSVSANRTINEIVKAPTLFLKNTKTNTEIVNDINILHKSTSGNKNSKLFSIGNSILTGSVFINEHFDHLAEFCNSPYGNIALSLGITEENVSHTIKSSAGLIYEGPNGNFYDTIIQTDFSDYDYLLTMIHYTDLSNYPIGNIGSTSEEETIAGYVLKVIEYLRTSNPNCKLILVGVPPVNVNGGEDIFINKYASGYSIIQLDRLLHEISEKYHFIFIDWESLALSYYYQDLTDGANIHANNENTYRAMGEYLGIQLRKTSSFYENISHDTALTKFIRSKNNNYLDKDDLNIQGYFKQSNGNNINDSNYHCGYIKIPSYGKYILRQSVSGFGDDRLYIPLYLKDKTYYKSIQGTAINNNLIQFTLSEHDYMIADYFGISSPNNQPNETMLILNGQYPDDYKYRYPEYIFNNKYSEGNPPMLTIIDDDGNPKFYTELLPLIESRKVPITSSVIVKNADDNASNHMTWEQIEDASKRGAEIVSHTYSHLTSDIADTLNEREIWIDYQKAKNTLYNHGLSGANYLVFGGASANNQDAQNASKRVYKCAFRSSYNINNFRESFEQYNIARYRVQTDGYDYNPTKLKELIDNCLLNGGWMVWMIHTSESVWTTLNGLSAITEAIDYAIEQGLPLVTVEEGYNTYCL